MAVMRERSAFIGLGAIGEGMARNIAVHAPSSAGSLRVYDVRPAAVAALSDDGVEPCRSAEDAARGADILHLTVFTAAQAETLLFGEPMLSDKLAPNAVIVNHTTVSPQHARALSEQLAQRGLSYLDAPVTGGKAGADAGTLTVIISGDEQQVERVRPNLDAMGSKIAFCGNEPGQAATVKMANQVLVGINVVASAEAIALATKAGADPKVVFDVLNSGAGHSTAFESRVPSMLSADYAPKGVVDIFTKDLGIALEAGHDLSFSLPVAAACLQQFLAAASMGHGRANDSAVVKVYEALGQIDVASAAKATRD